MNANSERLAAVFTELCEISSPSRKEGKVAQYIKDIFTTLGASEIYEDNSAATTGSDTGNLIVFFEGTVADTEPLLFACHMDTVLPAENIKVVRNGDIFTSAGETILGGDDKSGIAALIELFTLIKENNIDHGPIELLFTTCEEIGLLGAKGLEHSRLKAQQGFALDSSTINTCITKAPSANSITITLHGLAAHAGLSPEQGINTLTIAAKALTNLHIGRYDDETTSNFGIIGGGSAINIVPETLQLKGEVRSHNMDSLQFRTQEICDAFEKAVAEYENPHQTKRPSVEISVTNEYSSINVDPNSPLISRLKVCAESIGQNYALAASGGGSDANVLSSYGITMGILGTGMDKVHTTDEQIALSDMVELTKTLCALVAK